MKKRTPKNKFAFLWRLMADMKLEASAKCVATALLLKYHNTKTGRCNPSFSAIAKTVGRSRRVTFDAVDRLVEGGWIEVISTKGGSAKNTNQFKFNFEPVMSTAPLTSVANITGDVGSTEGCCQPHTNHLRTTLSPSERESGCAVIPFRALAPDGAAREGKEEKFQELCQIWQAKPHRFNEAKARKAFFAVCDAGGSPFEILASAQNWVAKTEPRYLKKLEDWLGDGVWRNDPPPPRAQVRRGGKQSLAALAMNYGSDQ